MTASSYFRAGFVLMMLLLAGLAGQAQAATPPAAPATVQRAQQATAYFAQSLGLSAPQVARLQVPMLRLMQANDSLARHKYATVARASAAHTVVEYRFFAAVVGILTPNQFDDLIVLHSSTSTDREPWMAAR